MGKPGVHVYDTGKREVMTYLEATETEFTYDEVEKEIEHHNLSMSDFVDDIGASDVYEGQTVLGWLGY